MIKYLELKESNLNMSKKITKYILYTLNALMIALVILALLDIYRDRGLAEPFGLLAGLAFILITLPGTLKRFQVKGFFKKVQTALQKNRTEISILMFLLMYYHHLILGNETIGVILLYLSLPLFLTSNKWSRKKLKKNWAKLHKLSYIATWLVALHLFAVGESTLGTILAVTGTLQIASLISEKYPYLTKNSDVS